MRLIDADALKEELENSKYIFGANKTIQFIQNSEIDRAISFIETAPTVEKERVVPVVQMTLDEEKLKKIVDRTIEEEIRPFLVKWTLCSEKLPDKSGVYLVTKLTRVWGKDKKDIIQGSKPPKDDYWEMHSNLYQENSDGLWVEIGQRVFHDGIWSGYDETVIAWMEMPEPYCGGDEE